MMSCVVRRTTVGVTSAMKTNWRSSADDRYTGHLVSLSKIICHQISITKCCVIGVVRIVGGGIAAIYIRRIK